MFVTIFFSAIGIFCCCCVDAYKEGRKVAVSLNKGKWLDCNCCSTGNYNSTYCWYYGLPPIDHTVGCFCCPFECCCRIGICVEDCLCYPCQQTCTGQGAEACIGCIGTCCGNMCQFICSGLESFAACLGHLVGVFYHCCLEPIGLCLGCCCATFCKCLIPSRW